MDIKSQYCWTMVYAEGNIGSLCQSTQKTVSKNDRRTWNRVNMIIDQTVSELTENQPMALFIGKPLPAFPWSVLKREFKLSTCYVLHLSLITLWFEIIWNSRGCNCKTNLKIIRRHTWKKNRQYNGQKKKDYRTNNLVVRFEWDGRLWNDNIT